jgi:hypothetical protein
MCPNCNKPKGYCKERKKERKNENKKENLQNFATNDLQIKTLFISVQLKADADISTHFICRTQLPAKKSTINYKYREPVSYVKDTLQATHRDYCRKRLRARLRKQGKSVQ